MKYDQILKKKKKRRGRERHHLCQQACPSPLLLTPQLWENGSHPAKITEQFVFQGCASECCAHSTNKQVSKTNDYPYSFLSFKTFASISDQINDSHTKRKNVHKYFA